MYNVHLHIHVYAYFLIVHCHFYKFNRVINVLLYSDKKFSSQTLLILVILKFYDRVFSLGVIPV